MTLYFIKGANVILNCPSFVNFNQTAICNLTIISNLGYYTINIDFGDGNILYLNTTDQTDMPISHNYQYAGSYELDVFFPLFQLDFPQIAHINVNEGIFRS